MIRDWLRVKVRGKHIYKFNIIDATETDIRTDLTIPTWLAEEILLAYKDPGHLKRRYFNRKKEELNQYLTTHISPPLEKTLEKNVRRGDFGEIITSLILRDINSLETTLIKLRYKLNRKKSSFGIDVFGVQLDKNGQVCGLCICETKTKITYDKAIGIKAHDSLFSDDQSAIITISDFMSNLYYTSGNYDLSDQFDKIVLQKANFPTNHHIFLVHEKDKFNEEILDELDKFKDLQKGIHVNVLLIENLDALMHESHSLIPTVGERLVYGIT